MDEPRLTMKEAVALISKAHRYGHSYDVIKEVFNRGLKEWDVNEGLTPKQFAFNRVNSFLAGGKAAKMDKDLTEGMNDEQREEWIDKDEHLYNVWRTSGGTNEHEGGSKNHFVRQNREYIDNHVNKKLNTVVTSSENVVESVIDELGESEDFSDDHIEKLKKAYGPLKGKKLPYKIADRLLATRDKMTDSQLRQLAKHDIPFISTVARTGLIKRGVKDETELEGEQIDEAKKKKTPFYPRHWSNKPRKLTPAEEGERGARSERAVALKKKLKEGEQIKDPNRFKKALAGAVAAKKD